MHSGQWLGLEAEHTVIENIVCVTGRDRDYGSVSADRADNPLNSAAGTGGDFIPREMDRAVLMGANAFTVLLAVAQRLKAVVAAAVIVTVAAIVTGSTA